MRIAVEPCEDVELWLVDGHLPDGFAFTLPIKLRPHRVVSGQEPSVLYRTPVAQYFNAAQYAQLSAILDAWDNAPADPDGWWFKRETLLKFARPAPGINPERHIRWPGWEVPPGSDEAEADHAVLDVSDPELSGAEQKFLKHLHQMTGLMDWPTTKLFWLGFRKHAIAWLADKQAPLDLGFCRIMPVPYRANWKEALATRFSVILGAFIRSPSKRQDTLRFHGFYSALTSVKLLAMDKQRSFAHWTLELVPNGDLAQAMDEFEYARYKRSSPAGYANSVLNRIAQRSLMIIDIFTQYARAIWHPPGTKLEHVLGAPRLAPDPKPGRVAYAKGVCSTIELSPEDAFKELRDEPPQPVAAEPPPYEEFADVLPAIRQIKFK